jgi:membrane-bound lytic murein transglycosylase B
MTNQNSKKPWLGYVISALMIMAVVGTARADYRSHPEAVAFIEEMVKDYGFAREQLKDWLSQAQKQQNILDAIARPAERVRSWREYRPIFVAPLRVNNGVKFWQEHREDLERAEQEYGVPAEVVVAIIGVETNYGRNMGSHRVIDALTTLAFDYPRRAPFFRRELKNYLLLTREHEQNPLDFKGSYAGAMGYGQFMPSSYRHYAVDFDGDGFADIWNNPTDAIGSVANYFRVHGWRPGEPVLFRARQEESFQPVGMNRIDPPSTPLAEWRERGLEPLLPLPDDTPAQALQLEGSFGEEFWFGTQNFYVITRYNRSHMYALAVYQLSQEIKTAMEAAE